jgi:3-oxoacyl-[acyl-carrier-protein] synthase-3
LIGAADRSAPVSITGLGAYAPDRVLTNAELATMVETSDEWIQERTGIRERRIAAPDQAMTDLALPAARQALDQAGAPPESIDYLVVATVTPDTMFPTTSALLADSLGAGEAAAYDLLAGCTGFMYALAHGYGVVASGLATRALVVGGDVLSRIVNWRDRSTCVLFGDGAGAVVVERVDSHGGFLGFELGADGGGGLHLSLPAGGSRLPASADTVAHGQHFVHMNGPEVYRFATRVLVSSAQKVLERCGRSVDEIDVYIPHQANVRIIEHAARLLGIPRDRVIVNVDRYGNTSSGSIPLALADAQAEGRLRDGALVLMTGMGAGLTWGSALLEWTERVEATAR